MIYALTPITTTSLKTVAAQVMLTPLPSGPELVFFPFSFLVPAESVGQFLVPWVVGIPGGYEAAACS